MFGSEILEIAIGLTLVYLLLSLVVTAATEVISRLVALRANNLYKGIQNLMGEAGVSSPVADKFFESPIIKSLTQPGSMRSLLMKKMAHRPSYIPSKRFYDGLIQSLRLDGKDLNDIADTLKASDITDDLKTNLQTFISEAGSDVEKFRSLVESWYNDSMDRVSGWFKRKAHSCTMVIAVLVTITFNASTIKVAEVLWNDDASRQTVAKMAADLVNNETSPVINPLASEEDKKASLKIEPNAIEKGKKAIEIIKQTSSIPLGWRGENPLDIDTIRTASKKAIPGWSFYDWLSHILGWTLTALALSLGAPFWFDTLKNLVNLRTSGTKPEEKKGAEQK
jgi:hypothetical protein